MNTPCSLHQVSSRGLDSRCRQSATLHVRVRRSSARLIGAALLAAGLGTSARAATDTWDNGAGNNLWQNALNWASDSGFPGATAGYTSVDDANFGATGAGSTIDLGGLINIRTLSMGVSGGNAASFGIADGNDTLHFTSGGGISVNAGVTTAQTIGSVGTAINLSDAAAAAVTFTNNGTGLLTIAGTVNAAVASGNGLLTVTGSGNTAISGAVTKTGAGFNALLKTGAGSLTLSSDTTWSGAGALGYVPATSVGFPLVTREGTLLINGGTHTVNGELVIGGVVANGGAGQNAKIQVDGGTLNVTSWFSVGRGNGTGTATSDLELNNGATVTAVNFSAGFNGGNAANLPKGTITLNGTSSFSVNNTINFAESPGANFTLNVNGTSLFRQTANSNQTRVGGGNGAIGVININGGTASFERDLVVGYTGTGSGKVVLNSGTLNMANATERWLIVNQNNTAPGEVTVNGGTLNLNAGTDLRLSTSGTSAGTNVVNLNGGAIVGNNATTNSIVDLKYSGTSGANNTFNLNGGTLTIAQVVTTNDTGTATFNFNGGTLKASVSTTDFFVLGGASQHAYVKTGGAIIDTNGNNVTIAQALEPDAGGSGGLTKMGGGTLTLSGANTYSGNTSVNESELALAATGSLRFVVGANGVSNKVTGSGIATFNGSFVFDLAGASTTFGHSWQIVDVASPTYGGTFAVTGFAANSGTWVKPANGTFYEFNPATGVLRVIADPGISYPPPTVTAGAYADSYIVGSTMALQASASGTGTLTYQWYYQATAGDPLSLISGATAASYSLSDVQTSGGGIYTLVVTDHAPEASGQAPTTASTSFTVSVITAAQAAVAYYRFEEGTSGANIATAVDSSASAANPLTAGANPAVFATDVPFAQIPATSAANAVSADFGTTGVKSLLAATNGALAGTTFTSFTIEAFAKFNTLTGVSTVVGRDDTANPGEGTGPTALFYLQRNGNFIRVELIDKSNITLAVASTTAAVVNKWYHIAAVGDVNAGTLKLYIDGQLIGTATGFTGLFVPTSGSDTPWTVGRGDYNGADTDAMRGVIDEVRFSRAALPPTSFLNSNGTGAVTPPTFTTSPTSVTARVTSNVTFTATAASTMGGTITYQWYKDGSILSGETGNTLTLTGITAASDGTYTVKAIDSAGSGGTEVSTTASAVLRVLDVPTAGRAISLNFVGASTGGNWSTLPGTLAASDSAGIVPVLNWNNSGTGVATQTTPLALVENTGASSSVTAIWESANTWAARTGTGDPATKTGDFRLLHGYIETRAATGASVTVSNIPYASYDVYVYIAGGGNGTIGKTSINREGSAVYYYRVAQHDAYTATSISTMIGLSTDATAAASAPAATFVRFAGVTGADLTITTSDNTLNANAGGIAAISIVDRTPAGTPYPPTATLSSASQMKAGGSSASFTVTASSNNSGGVLSYQWQKDGVNIGGQTSATLSLSSLTGSASGTYSVVITDNSSLGAASTTRNASLVVVDATRPLLINGDLKASGVATFVGNGILRTTGSSNTDLGVGTTVWNGVLGAAGSATRSLAKESTGLTLPGVSFTYAGAEGVEDNTAAGFINGTAMVALSRDYLYTDNQTTPLTGSISGLDAFVGQEVTLVVYAYGKLSMAFNEAATSDTATVTLATANNHLGSAPYATSTGSFEGRNIVDNNLISTSGATAAYATFTGVVAPGGTVNWSIGADSDAGRIPLVGFQLLLTGNNLAPAVPTGLAAVGGNNQVSLTWNAVSGADTYTIGRSTTSGGPYTTISAGLVTGTSYTDSTAVNGTTYYYVVASAKTSPAVQSAYSAQVSATPANSATGLQTWRQTHFGTTANSGNAANTADPDGDGLVNLLEYALGTNPTVAAASPVTVGQSGGTLTLTFSPVVDTNLSYAIEASSDLAGAWSTVHTYGSFASTAPVTYTDSVVLSSVNSKRFLRLKVTSTE